MSEKEEELDYNFDPENYDENIEGFFSCAAKIEGDNEFVLSKFEIMGNGNGLISAMIGAVEEGNPIGEFLVDFVNALAMKRMQEMQERANEAKENGEIIDGLPYFGTETEA